MLCREKEYFLLRRLIGADQIESGSSNVPSVIYVHGAPQTGKKLLVSTVIKSLLDLKVSTNKSLNKPKVRSALVSCHIGSFGSSTLFEELWRQISSYDYDEFDEKGKPFQSFLTHYFAFLLNPAIRIIT